MMDRTREDNKTWVKDPRRISWGASFHSAQPREEHWAILTPETVYIPGDERSRSHPGHGYPASTQNTLSYQWYETEEAMKDALIKAADGSIGIHVPKIYKRVNKIEVV